MTSDNYFGIRKNSHGIYKEKGSKFLAFAIPISSEIQAKKEIQRLKKEHHDARHHCYAFLIDERYCENDDGEPSFTAGRPILKQIRSYKLNHILIVVVRYFGGTKLGIGGLINAYKNAAKSAIENAEILTKIITESLTFTYNYEKTTEVMRIIDSRKATIEKQEFTGDCFMVISIRKKELEDIKQQLQPIVRFAN